MSTRVPTNDELAGINERVTALFAAAAKAQGELGEYLIEVSREFPGLQITKGPIKEALVEMAEILMQLDAA